MRRSYPFAALALLAAVACEDRVTMDVKRALAGSKAAFVEIQRAVAAERSAGRMSDERWGRWLGLESRYIAAHNAAVRILGVLTSTRDMSMTERVVVAVATAFSILDEIRVWIKS